MRSHGSSTPAGRARSAIRRLRGSARLLVLVALVLVVAVAASVAVYAKRRRPVTLVEELADASIPRNYAVQLSVKTKFRPCRMQFRPGRIPSARCRGAGDEQPSKDVSSLVERISVQADSGDRVASHADALLDFVFGEPRRGGLLRVIERLQLLIRGRYEIEDSLTDLSAALLVRAGIYQQMLDLASAVEAAEAALDLDSSNKAALFNRALALQALMLNSEAAQAWDDYLAVDSEGPWAEEARWYQRLLRWQPSSMPPANADDATLRVFAGTSPQQARELGWDEFLGQWGSAVLLNDSVAARASLHRAEVVGLALEAGGRDASLADEARIIAALGGDTLATAGLAKAHQQYSAGRREYRDIDYAAADTFFAKAYALADASPILKTWALAFYGTTHRAEDPDAARQRARESLARIDAIRYPALAARAHWTMAALLNKANQFEAAADAYAEALRLEQRAGEDEYSGAIMGGVNEVEFPSSAQAPSYYSAWYAAGWKLEPYRASQSLHRHLVYLSRHLVEDGFPRTALHVNNELAAVAARSGVDLLVVEAHDFRGEAFARTGDVREALREIRAAQPLLDSIDPNARVHFTALLSATRAVAEIDRDPLAAEAALSAAIRMLNPSGVPVRVTTLRLALADARVALGKTDSARADLLAALEVIKQGRVPKPAGLSQTAGPDALTTLRRVVARLVTEGRDTAALRLLEYGTAILGRGAPEPLPTAIPRGRVVVRYAFAGDTILAWTLAGKNVHVTPTPVSQAAFREHLRTLTTLLEHREDLKAQRELRRLYDWLIRPVEDELGEPGDELVIVPDGTLENVPWAALRNAAGEYLMEKYVIPLAGSVAGAASQDTSFASSSVAGVVQDPAIDRQVYPDLHQLHGASDEVAALSGWAPSVLAGTHANVDSVRRLLGRVSLFHFAGHAVADPLMPDSSFLVLATTPGMDDLGRLTAAEIAAMDLTRLNLVVLSACSTLGDSDAGGGGFAGLSGAFLGAGAKGVIGSLWQVNDDRTRELVSRFYVEYWANPNPAAALRQAQRKMRNSRDPAWASPSAWAAFEYVGR